MDQVTQIKTQLRMEQWKQLIEECQKSEMSVTVWCKENNVSESSYYYYLKRFRQQAIASLTVPMETENKTIFKKVEVSPYLSNPSAAVVLRLPQATLEIAEGTSQQTIQAAQNTFPLPLRSTLFSSGSCKTSSTRKPLCSTASEIPKNCLPQSAWDFRIKRLPASGTGRKQKSLHSASKRASCRFIR